MISAAVGEMVDLEDGLGEVSRSRTRSRARAPPPDELDEWRRSIVQRTGRGSSSFRGGSGSEDDDLGGGAGEEVVDLGGFSLFFFFF